MQNENLKIAQQYRTMIVLWAALLMSQLMFVVLVFLSRPQLFKFDLSQPLAGNSIQMILGFAVAAIALFIFSFAFKKKLNERAVVQQDPALVQSGLIIACALCEASSLLGVCLAFAFEYQYFFLWIAFGVFGTLMHFPREESLIAASDKE